MQAIVHSASVQDRDGGVMLLTTLLGRFPFLEKLFADSAYQGPIFANAVAKILSGVTIEIVKRSDQAKGFVTLPKRWIVERTIAWLNRCRRLAKDWENLNVTALVFLRLAFANGVIFPRICRRAAPSIDTFAIRALMARWIASMTRSTKSVASRPNARPARPPPSSTARAFRCSARTSRRSAPLACLSRACGLPASPEE